MISISRLKMLSNILFYDFEFPKRRPLPSFGSQPRTDNNLLLHSQLIKMSKADEKIKIKKRNIPYLRGVELTQRSGVVRVHHYCK